MMIINNVAAGHIIEFLPMYFGCYFNESIQIVIYVVAEKPFTEGSLHFSWLLCFQVSALFGWGCGFGFWLRRLGWVHLWHRGLPPLGNV